MLFNESLITRARNYAVDEYMRSDFSHFIFVDADVGFTAMDVITLMLLQTPESPYDIIGAAYPKKTISWEKIVAAVNKGFGDIEAGHNPEELNKFVGDYVFNPKSNAGFSIFDPAEVLEIGTGFMMVKRTAFQKFADSHPELYYKPDHVRTEHFDGHRQIVQYFQAEIDQIDFRKFYETELKKLLDKGQDVPFAELEAMIKRATEENAKKSNRYLSEDYWWCQRAHEVGITTWLCPWMKLNHTGSMVYGGSLLDISALGVTPTADPALLQKFKEKKA
jgi:hypothetical protein